MGVDGFIGEAASVSIVYRYLQNTPEALSVVTDPFLICRVSSMRPSYVSCVHIGVTASTSLSRRIISSMPPLPAAALSLSAVPVNLRLANHSCKAFA